MLDLWIPISDISREGQSFTFDDQELWHEGWKEFSISLEPGADLVAEVTVMPQVDEGVLVRGTLKGSVMMPCDRCAEPFEFSVDETFDVYEQLPGGEADDDEPRVRMVSGQLQLDMGAVLWEVFALALPVKPLCSDTCEGVCPKCGQNLNEGVCDCEQDEGDERLAVFRNLKIK
ncbi:YceD family protein [Pseudodesulfovibrio sp.]|uniref:YceD family protein n=1 Tax=unclassified Pseudodesulfovibrio TaxID=2661612 RepID=UPI003B00C940